MESDVKSFSETKHNDFKEFHQHAENLQKNINLLTSNCTMSGEAHDELHKWLIPYMELVNKLSEAEIAYFVSAVYLRKMSINETIDLTRAIIQAGKILNFDHKKIIADKHCIGGLAGNRTTPIVTSIIAAAIEKYKLKAVMPKTSSRAISSAAGTADVMETITNVEFSTGQIKEILERKMRDIDKKIEHLKQMKILIAECIVDVADND